LCFTADIDRAGCAAITSLARDIVPELADSAILTSRFWVSGGVGGEKEEVECELEGVSGVGGVV
jgi:hypothetical protein